MASCWIFQIEFVNFEVLRKKVFLKTTNIEEKLEKLRANENEGEKILQAVHHILERDSEKQYKVKKNLTEGPTAAVNAFVFDLLETNKIYHINQIKKICIDYRLRFLDSKYYKGEIPQEAVSKIKQMENAHGIEVQGFKILAPSKLFKLKDKDDPLLFAPIGNDYFYLIHKWGNDLHPLRKLYAWPFKNIINLAVLVLLVSYLCTALVPIGLFSKSSSEAERLIIFFFMFKSVAAVVIFYWVALGKNFNPAIWKSKYLKA